MDEEVRKALHGVKQMKEIMVKNEEKHEHLMKSLRHSNDKKKVILAALYHLCTFSCNLGVLYSPAQPLLSN